MAQAPPPGDLDEVVGGEGCGSDRKAEGTSEHHIHSLWATSMSPFCRHDCTAASEKVDFAWPEVEAKIVHLKPSMQMNSMQIQEAQTPRIPSLLLLVQYALALTLGFCLWCVMGFALLVHLNLKSKEREDEGSGSNIPWGLVSAAPVLFIAVMFALWTKNAWKRVWQKRELVQYDGSWEQNREIIVQNTTAFYAMGYPGF